MLYLLVACVLGFLALCLIPVGQNRFTKYGERTPNSYTPDSQLLNSMT
ncbi:hypothetical protein AciPR4_3614 [Terriglobus saanensis SP1PR4]|uniref:Uncharacterized protein n=1 Tax=Terriglobus saanensis (strain ATCC BAA-1853 / DSM 23119 / SP1PR4) TaxID=401053 RepID=E8UZM4_TERSS|nr:hypothetical protein AciPR4_3614 [Terriglobus saanensis SP1PR4]